MHMRAKVLFMNVNGSLTDGKVSLSVRRELMKAFDVKVSSHSPSSINF